MEASEPPGRRVTQPSLVAERNASAGHRIALWACLALYTGYIGLGAVINALLGMLRRLWEHFVIVLKSSSWAMRGLAKVYAELVKDDPASQPGSKTGVVDAVAIGQHDSKELRSLFWRATIAQGKCDDLSATKCLSRLYATIAQSECDELLAMKCSPRAIRLLEPGDWVDFALVAPGVAYRALWDAGITSKDDQAIILHYSQQKVLAVEGRGSCNLGKGGEPQPEEIKRNRASGPEDSEKAMDA